MPFGVVSGVTRGIGVLDGGGDRRRRRGSFGGEFGAAHCNQLGLGGDALFPNYIGEDLFSLDRFSAVSCLSARRTQRTVTADAAPVNSCTTSQKAAASTITAALSSNSVC